ncbi:O-acetylhomoserine aminocarboxypropyltransferase/cysteine synthase [Orbaceae bacterium ac157xtp]
MTKQLHLETIAVHQNYRGDETNAIVRPIHLTSAYYFNDSDHGASLFDLNTAGNIYSRLTNPTNDALGTLVSDLEGGAGGLAVATGAAAITTVILTLCKQGDHIVASRSLYGGTITLLSGIFTRLGIHTTFVDQSSNIDELQKSIQKNTKFVLAEVIDNPLVNVLDFEKFSKLAHDNQIPLVIDSTFTPPTIFKPIEHGADIIVHSATKYLGGHGNVMAGIIVDAGKFDWQASGKFDNLTQPDPAYHGLSFSNSFGNLAFIVKARAQALRDTGLTLSPFNAFLISTGIQTLAIRLAHISQNTLKIAEWLETHPHIEWVSYPLLKSHPDYQLAKQYFKHGASGILSFGIKGTLANSKLFIDSVKLAIQAVNVGDVRTIVTHPASTTHRQCSDEELKNAGITQNLIRLSVGLENIEDLKADLDQALIRSQALCQ